MRHTTSEYTDRKDVRVDNLKTSFRHEDCPRVVAVWAGVRNKYSFQFLLFSASTMYPWITIHLGDTSVLYDHITTPSMRLQAAVDLVASQKTIWEDSTIPRQLMGSPTYAHLFAAWLRPTSNSCQRKSETWINVDVRAFYQYTKASCNNWESHSQRDWYWGVKSKNLE